MDIFLEFIGLTEQEFVEIAVSHQVSPHKHDQSKIGPGKKLADFYQWSRKGGMPREETEKILERWKRRQA